MPGRYSHAMVERRIRVLVVAPDGEAAVATIPNELKAFQLIVEGHIEAIAGPNGLAGPWVAYVNDEGKWTKSHNDHATALATHLGWPGAQVGDYLSGNVVFLGHSGADETDIPNDVLEVALTFFGADTA